MGLMVRLRGLDKLDRLGRYSASGVAAKYTQRPPLRTKADRSV